jgi:hypothetical protein
MIMAKPKYDPVKEREDATRRLVGNSDEWPRWPFLPMKRPGTWDFGLMVEEDSDTYNIYLGINLFDRNKDFDKAKVVSFHSVGELIAAGWTVD